MGIQKLFLHKYHQSIFINSVSYIIDAIDVIRENYISCVTLVFLMPFKEISLNDI